MIGLKCPVCGSNNVYENSTLVKVETGDWGICRDCNSVIRTETIRIDSIEKEEGEI